ncbi:MAG: FliA/WhiG family RNA polymerase sigma factor [Ilumatobacteraceae bacterium]
MTPPPPPPAGQRPGLVDAATELAEQWNRWNRRRASSARDHLIVHYSPLVKFVAGRVGSGLPRSVDPADLVGYGVFGLIDAIEKFDPSHGVKFETYAAPRIRGAIYDGLRELDWVPRTVRTRGRRIEQALTELERELGRSPSEDELAVHLEISIDELATWLSEVATTTVGTLDRAISMGFEPEADELDGSHTPVVAVEAEELRSIIRQVMRELPERERLVLSLYYDENLTLADIAEILDVTESRVSQLHAQSVLRLRSRMRVAGHL